MLSTGCTPECEPFSDTGAEAYGGGSATLSFVAEADDGITANGTDTGASALDLDAAFFLPDDDSWAFFDGSSLYVQVCAPVTAPGCATADACFESDYLPVGRPDGQPHDISGESGLYILGEARAGTFAEATIVMPERWQGSAVFGPFTWEDLDGSCLTSFGSTSATVTWSFHSEVRKTWPPKTVCAYPP